MDPSKCFIWAMNCPEETVAARRHLDSNLQGKDISKFHTLICEWRYGNKLWDAENGYAFILLGDEDKDGWELRATLGWGKQHFMNELMLQVCDRIPFTRETDHHPLSFTEWDADLQKYVRFNIAPIEWHSQPDEFMDTRLFAIGLNGQRPHKPWSPLDEEMELL